MPSQASYPIKSVATFLSVSTSTLSDRGIRLRLKILDRAEGNLRFSNGEAAPDLRCEIHLSPMSEPSEEDPNPGYGGLFYSSGVVSIEGLNSKPSIGGWVSIPKSGFNDLWDIATGSAEFDIMFYMMISPVGPGDDANTKIWDLEAGNSVSVELVNIVLSKPSWRQLAVDKSA